MKSGMGKRVAQLLPPLLLDGGVIAVSFLLALLLRFEGEVSERYIEGLVQFLPVILPAYLVPNYAFGVYRRLWRYATGNEVIHIWSAALVGTVAVGGVNFLLGTPRLLPTSVVVMGGVFVLGVMTAIRYRERLITGFLWRWKHARGTTRVLIVGAGEAGQLLAYQLMGQPQRYDVVGFIDDDQGKIGRHIHGVRVLGNRDDIKSAADRVMADIIVIAIHRISGQDFRAILERCQETSAQIKVLPNILGLMDVQTGEPLLRDVAVEDLLGRKTVPINHEVCRELLAGKVVLVTGAGGSIGSELCRQIVQFQPGRLLLLDNNESAVFDLALRVALPATSASVLPIVADVLREKALREVFEKHHPEIIFHCAAYKHVPLMEEYPLEAVLVNVLGTRNLCLLAQEFNVERFVLISSDKAVDPSSVMGMTKRLGEQMTVTMERAGGCRFVAVRFGNVLNSRGSVVPTFQWQIQTGQPITITDPRMKRFFMSSLEAVNLILEAATLTQGGDIFLLDMGEEIGIVDLAHRLIRLQGLRVDRDVQIEFTGLRPGEKLVETLVHEPWEERVPTGHPYIFRVRRLREIPKETLFKSIDDLVRLAEEGCVAEATAMLRLGTGSGVPV